MPFAERELTVDSRLPLESPAAVSSWPSGYHRLPYGLTDPPRRRKRVRRRHLRLKTPRLEGIPVGHPRSPVPTRYTYSPRSCRSDPDGGSEYVPCSREARGERVAHVVHWRDEPFRKCSSPPCSPFCKIRAARGERRQVIRMYAVSGGVQCLLDVRSTSSPLVPLLNASATIVTI
ncbi:hypothetical protein OH77DRAFT_1417995, partial [Trametes cingulata]